MIGIHRGIKCIKIETETYKIMQYADDTVILLDGSEDSLKSCLNIIQQYSKFSGLMPNIEKTQCIWVGSKRNSTEKLCPEYNIAWTSEPFTVLGVVFSVDLKDMISLNYDSKVDEINRLLSYWSQRMLTVIGRMTVAKTIFTYQQAHLLPLSSTMHVKFYP